MAHDRSAGPLGLVEVLGLLPGVPEELRGCGERWPPLRGCGRRARAAACVWPLLPLPSVFVAYAFGWRIY
jgi:hypothetical protein